MADDSTVADLPRTTLERSNATRVWGGIPVRNPDFTGRESLLRALQRSLEARSKESVLPHALHGFGGVGKTQVAVEYAYRFADRYDLVWWIPAGQRPLVLQSLADLGRQLGIPDRHEAIRTAPLVIDALNSTSLRWLLIYDNADEPHDLAGLLPSAGGHVILTSRNRTWSTAWQAIEVNVFERPESISATPDIYVSYRWGGDAEAMVDLIDSALAQRGLPVRRDKHEIPYRGSIQEFVRRLGSAEFVIVVLDDAYLRSPNCMFELTQIADREDFARRVFPIVLGDADIFDVFGRVRYVKYWAARRAELEVAMREVPLGSLDGIREEFELYAKIGSTIARITDVLRNMNTLTVTQHVDNDFALLIRSIREEHARSIQAGNAGKPSPD